MKDSAPAGDRVDVAPHLPGILHVVRRQSDAISFGAAALVIVIVFGFVLSHTYAVTHADLSVDKAFSHAHRQVLTTITHAVYTIISPAPAIVITAILTAIIWARTRNLRAAVTFAVLVAVSWVPSDIVKILVHRHRPDPTALAHPFLPTPPDPSYPSGHVVFAASLAMAFIFLARGTRFQGLAITLGIVGAAVVGLSVIYLGVHYPTDVIASLLWSVAATTIILTLWNRYVIPRTYRALAAVDTARR
ncbi:hypothetical protein AX769_12135 [Frondihabitans sp. PAMC 28766]|nr:hypothetical protein AX769_12135 [Frondihabitans sp. PAMC 28766]